MDDVRAKPTLPDSYRYTPPFPVRLDPIHLRILSILERDGRTPVSHIARAVGLTDNAVRYRIRKLHSMGIVRRFTVHVDPARLGRPAAAVVLLRLAPGASPNGLLTSPPVAMALPTRGPYQAMLLVVGRDNQELERYLRELRAAEGVLECTALGVGPDAELPVLPSACTNGA